jgi:hypothetical protein
MNETGIV